MEATKSQFAWLDKVIRGSILGYAFFAPISISFSEIFIGLAITFWIIKLVLLRKKFSFYKTGIEPFLLLLFLGMILASIFAYDKVSAFKGSLFLWQAIILFVLVYESDEKLVKQAFFTLLFSTFLVAVYGIIQHYVGMDYWRGYKLPSYGKYYEARGFFNFHLTYGGFILVVLMTSMGFFMELIFGKKEVKGRVFWFYIFFSIVYFVVLFLALLFSYARSAWVGLFGGILLLSFLKNKKLFVISFIVLLVSTFAIYSFGDSALRYRMKRVVSLQKNRDRLSIYYVAINIIKEHPIFGIGNENLKYFYDKYCKRFRKEGKNWIIKPLAVVGHAHNDFLEMYLSGGLLGFIGYLGIFIVFFVKSIRFLQDKSRLWFYRGIVFGSIGGIFAILVASLFQCYFSDSENGMLLWFIMGLAFWVMENFTYSPDKT